MLITRSLVRAAIYFFYRCLGWFENIKEKLYGQHGAKLTRTKLLKLSSSSVTPFALLPHFWRTKDAFQRRAKRLGEYEEHRLNKERLGYKRRVLLDLSNFNNTSFECNVGQKQRTSRSERSTVLTSSPHKSKQVSAKATKDQRISQLPPPPPPKKQIAKRNKKKLVKPKRRIISYAPNMLAVSGRSADRAMTRDWLCLVCKEVLSQAAPHSV